MTDVLEHVASPSSPHVRLTLFQGVIIVNSLFIAILFRPSENSCQALRQAYPELLDDVYQLNDTRNPGSHFLAHCDMASFGGGWTMCYTTDNLADPKDETTYSANLPYPKDGYRSNCNDITVSSTRPTLVTASSGLTCY